MGRLIHQEFPGATYFVTTNAFQSTSIFQITSSAEVLVRKMLEYRDKGNYFLHEFVVMPNHLHLLITPASSTSLERGMQLIKGGSSYEIHRLRGTNSQVWQSGFHESRVRDPRDYKIKADYIFYNPVVAKLVSRPEEWLFGSASGLYRLDPIPQRLKPKSQQTNVGPEGPTPNTFSEAAKA